MRPVLELHLAGQTTPDIQVALSAHLPTCAECLSVVQTYAQAQSYAPPPDPYASPRRSDSQPTDPRAAVAADPRRTSYPPSYPADPRASYPVDPRTSYPVDPRASYPASQPRVTAPPSASHPGFAAEVSDVLTSWRWRIEGNVSPPNCRMPQVHILTFAFALGK